MSASDILRTLFGVQGKAHLETCFIASLPIRDAKNMPVVEVSKPSNITAQKALIQSFGQSILYDLAQGRVK